MGPERRAEAIKELQYFLAFGKTAGWIGFMLPDYLLYFGNAFSADDGILYEPQGLLTGKKNIPLEVWFSATTWDCHTCYKNVSVGMFSLIFGVALGGLYLCCQARNGKRLPALYMCVRLYFNKSL